MGLFRELAAIGSITISCYCVRIEAPDPGESRMPPDRTTTHWLLQRDQNKSRANIDSVINSKIRID